MGIGTSIDKERNIYFTTVNGVHKFSPDGELLWTYGTKSGRESYGLPFGYEKLSKAVALMGDNLYGISNAGRAFCVDKDTGDELWYKWLPEGGSDSNFGQMMASDGVVVTAINVSDTVNRYTRSCCGAMNHKVIGLDGRDGTMLWEYEPDQPVWNFGSAPAEDGTFVYQDLEGFAYRHFLQNGSLIWKAETGIPESWTDGQANLGANSIVYSVANYAETLTGEDGLEYPEPGSRGLIAATDLKTGKVLWKKDVEKSPNSIPAVGRLLGSTDKKLSVVIPIGQNDKAGERIDVLALDANTGEQQWVFRGPTQKVNFGAGDEKRHREERIKNHVGPYAMPNSWGLPVIDAKGTVYVGGTTGDLYALNDQNGDGEVSGADEVSSLSTDAAFVGSSGAAFAPGLMAIGNANSLIVYQYPSK
jgi:outer membrane protein assembly factor BamB